MGAWVGPIVAGNVADYIGWRWFFWISAILQGVSRPMSPFQNNFANIRLQASIIAMIAFFPETKYTRAESEHPCHTATAEESASTADLGEAKTRIADTKDQLHLQHLEAAEHPSHIGRGRPTVRQQWGLNFKVDKSQFKFLARDFVTPIQIASYPIIIFAACCVGFGANCLLVLNLLESPGFSAPPYNFSPASVGFVNFALMVGGIVGLILGGPFSDWVSMKLTRKNRGIREPEMRLLALVPFLVIGLIGLLVNIPQNYSLPTILTLN